MAKKAPGGYPKKLNKKHVARRTLAKVGPAYREQFYRSSITGWTPERLINAMNSADAGMMRDLADMCENIFRGDDRASGVMSTRTHALLGRPVDFAGGSPEAKAALQGKPELGIKGEFEQMHDESEAAEFLTWGLTMGVALAQRIELPRLIGQPQRWRMQTWHPRWLTYRYNAPDGFNWWVTTAQDGLIPIMPGDGKWMLFTPYGENRPWSKGLWRALAFPWLYKQYALEDRANYGEAMGNPTRVGKTTQGSTERQRRDFLSQLRTLGKNGTLVLPEGWSYDLVESTGKGLDTYAAQIERADEAMTVVIAGQTVTTEGTPGFSDGDEQSEIKQDLTRFDSKRLSTCLQTQSLELWALMNYGSTKAAPTFSWQIEKPDDINDEADSMQKLGAAITTLNAALASAGFRVDVAKIIEKYNIPVVDMNAKPVSPPPVPGEQT